MADHREIVRRRELALAERIVDHVNGDGSLNGDGDGSRADTAPTVTR
jgi:hypothetical protein